MKPKDFLKKELQLPIDVDVNQVHCMKFVDISNLLYKYARTLQLQQTDVMCSFIKDNLSIGLSMDGTSVTVKLFLKDEIISEYTESMTIYKRDIEGLD